MADGVGEAPIFREHQYFAITAGGSDSSTRCASQRACGYTSAQIALEALQRAGRELTVDSLLHAMETITDFHDLFGGSYTFTPTSHHGATQAFLAVVHNGRWVPVLDHALAY